MTETLLQNEVIADQPLGEGVSQSQNQSSSTVLHNQSTAETPLPQSTTKTAQELISPKLDTMAKKILSDFDFGTQDYAGAVKAGSIEWNNTTGAITSGDGVVVYRGGIVGAKNGAATFSLDADTGDAVFAGSVKAGSGSEIENLYTYDTFVAGETLAANQAVYQMYIENLAPVNPTLDRGIIEPGDTGETDPAQNVIGGRAPDNTQRWALFTFDISSLPAGADNATFKFVYNNSSPGGVGNTFRLYRVTSSWNSSTIWSTKPSYTTEVATASTSGSESSGTPLYFDITTLYNQWKAGTYTNYGFIIIPDGGTALYYFRGNNIAQSDKPQLLVVGASVNNKGKVYKAKSDSGYTCGNFVGFTKTAANAGEVVKVQTSGIIDPPSAISLTSRNVYVSESTPGDVQTVAPAFPLPIGETVVDSGGSAKLLLKIRRVIRKTFNGKLPTGFQPLAVFPTNPTITPNPTITYNDANVVVNTSAEYIILG